MVIDGQQRITTLFILLKAIYDKAVEMGENRLIDELNDYLYNRNCEEEFKLKLKPIKGDILSQERWNEEAIKARARNLSERVMAIFYYPEPTERIERNYSNEKYTLDDLEIMTGRRPTSMSIVGEIFEVESFSEMLIKTMNWLGDMDIKLMNRLAENDFRISQAEKTYISYDESKLRRAKELGDTGIFFEINLSARNILQFIKELLECYGLDRDDFYFTIQE